MDAEKLLRVLLKRINIKMVVNKGRKRAKRKRKYNRKKEREAEEKRPFV